MKKIQPVSIWQNGANAQATKLSLAIINDNLSTTATFYYQLLSEDLVQLSQGNLVVDGTEYDDWGDASNVNDEAYVICASKLNLTLV